MKKITQCIVVVMGLFLTTSACRKDPATNTPTPVTQLANISKIEKDGVITEADYNTDGSIKTLTLIQSSGTIGNVYAFTYTNGRVSEISFGGKWKYNYTGSLLSSVETYNAAGALRYRNDFVYTNGSVTEKIDYIINAAGARPYYKAKYYYRPDGNVSRKEFFDYVNNDWLKAEEMSITEYDNYVNNSGPFESYPYLPKTLFSPNNPVRETWIDNAGNLTGTVEHTYTYDNNGRPVARKTRFKYPGFPDTVSDTKIQY